MRFFKFIKRLFLKRMSAVLDPEDGSITLSERLYKSMDKACGGQLKEVYCFQVNKGDGTHTYGWTCNPKDSIFRDDKEGVKRPVAEVQYNTKTRTIGFMPTNPTLALMYYNLNLVGVKTRVSVSKHKSNGTIYYQIEL